MAVAVDRVAVRVLNPVAGVSIPVAIPAFEAADVRVVYGIASRLAVQNVDYTVTLANDFNTFTVVPTASLIAKIDTLIAANPAETRAVTIRRLVNLLTTSTPALARYTPFTSTEHDRSVMRDQQLNERINRSIQLGERFVGDEASFTIDELIPGRALIANAEGTGIIAGPNAQDIAAAQANAAAALAARIAAQAARDAAQAALGEVQAINFYVPDLAALRADTITNRPVGTIVQTRLEGHVARVVSAATARPHIVTAGGVRLTVDKWGGDDTGALKRIGLRIQNNQPVKIACYGDSSVANTDSVEAYNNWPNRLASIMRSMSGNMEAAVYNCGDNGKRVSDWWAYDNLAAKITTPFPLTEFVMVCWGLNDIKYDGAPNWNPELFKSRYVYHLTQLRLAGYTPIMVTPWLISAAPVRPNQTMQGELLNAVREIAAEQKVVLLDTNDMLKSWQRDRRDNFRMRDVQPDGTHFLDQGCILVAQYISYEIFKDRVVEVEHGSTLGPQNTAYSPEVTVVYNDWVSNVHGFSAQLTATDNVNIAAEVWVWSDRARKVVYVSPDRSNVNSAGYAAVYSGPAGTPDETGVIVDFGAATLIQTDKPAENHIFVSDLPFGLSRLRFRCSAAGTFEYGGWLIVDQFDPVATAAYSVSASPLKELFLPEFAAYRPEVVPKLAGSTNMMIIGDVPVGWGVVIGTQNVYQVGANTKPSGRKQSLVAFRTATGAKIYLVKSANTGVFSTEDITTTGTGAWVGPVSVHCTISGGGVEIQVRAAGQVIAVHNSAGTAAFRSAFGRMGGLYRDAAVTVDPAGRQASAQLILMPTS